MRTLTFGSTPKTHLELSSYACGGQKRTATHKEKTNDFRRRRSTVPVIIDDFKCPETGHLKVKEKSEMKKRRSSEVNEQRAKTALVVRSHVHEQFGKIRVVIIDEEPWFFAIDVAKSLAFEDTKHAIRRHCKKAKSLMISNGGVTPPFEIVDEFGNQYNKLGTSPKIIPESDLYRLIMGSQLPEAEAFQDWVVEEVLPSIRKTGHYTKPGMTQLEALQHSAGILQESVNALVEHEKKLKEHESKLTTHDDTLISHEGRIYHIESVSKSAMNSLSTTELSERRPGPLTTRAKINMAVREFCIANGVQFDNVWNALYRQIYYRHGINIKARAKNKNVSKLDMAESLNLLDKMWDILSHLIKENPNNLKKRTKSQKDKDRAWMRERRRRADKEEDEFTKELSDDDPENLH